jgi:hypothetical protein
MKIPLNLLKPKESHEFHGLINGIPSSIPKATYI